MTFHKNTETHEDPLLELRRVSTRILNLNYIEMILPQCLSYCIVCCALKISLFSIHPLHSLHEAIIKLIAMLI
jgi:hypothetical protein